MALQFLPLEKRRPPCVCVCVRHFFCSFYYYQHRAQVPRVGVYVRGWTRRHFFLCDSKKCTFFFCWSRSTAPRALTTTKILLMSLVRLHMRICGKLSSTFFFLSVCVCVCVRSYMIICIHFRPVSRDASFLSSKHTHHPSAVNGLVRSFAFFF